MKIIVQNTVGLYPTPVIIVGAMNNDLPTWTLVAHTGIVAHDRILVSLAKPHFINHLIKKSNRLSINLINKELLPLADYCGMHSASKVDKSKVFEYESTNNLPFISNAPLSMECEVESIIEVGVFENLILKVNNTYVEESCLNENGKIDILKVNPILFSMPSYEYLTLGSEKMKCLSFAKEVKMNE